MGRSAVMPPTGIKIQAYVHENNHPHTPAGSVSVSGHTFKRTREHLLLVEISSQQSALPPSGKSGHPKATSCVPATSVHARTPPPSRPSGQTHVRKWGCPAWKRAASERAKRTLWLVGATKLVCPLLPGHSCVRARVCVFVYVWGCVRVRVCGGGQR